MRRYAGLVVALSGLAIVGLSLGYDAFTRADQAQQLLDGARPIVAPPHLQRDFEAGLVTVRRTQQLLAGAAFQQVASQLGQTPSQFRSAVGERWPVFARGEQQASAIDAAATAILANLQRHQRDFERADSIPVAGLALVDAIWVLVGFGVLVLATGVWLILRPDLVAAVLVLGFGIAFVAGALALGLPGKTAASQRVIASLNLSPTKNAQVRAKFLTVDDAFRQLETALLPEVARDLGVTTDVLRSRLDAAAPGLAPGLAQVPRILDHFGRAVQFRIDNVRTFAAIRGYPFQTFMWLAIALGGVAGLGGAIALATTANGDRRGGAAVA